MIQKEWDIDLVQISITKARANNVGTSWSGDNQMQTNCWILSMLNQLYMGYKVSIKQLS